MAVCQSGQPIPHSTFCRRFIESVRMMACVICASRWEAGHCIACVTASTSMVRLEVMTLWAPLSEAWTRWRRCSRGFSPVPPLPSPQAHPPPPPRHCCQFDSPDCCQLLHGLISPERSRAGIIVPGIGKLSVLCTMTATLMKHEDGVTFPVS